MILNVYLSSNLNDFFYLQKALRYELFYGSNTVNKIFFHGK
jgi:hypothetical protein